MSYFARTAYQKGRIEGRFEVRVLLVAVFVIAAGQSAGGAVAPQPPLVAYEEIRAMCRGEVVPEPEFRTEAAHRLFARSLRERCRAYLLGQVDGQLAARGVGASPCLPPRISPTEVADAVAATIVQRAEAPDGGVAALVRDVLRDRYDCA